MSTISQLLILASKSYIAKKSGNAYGIVTTTSNLRDFITNNNVSGIDVSKLDDTALQAAYYVSKTSKKATVDKDGIAQISDNDSYFSVACDKRLMTLTQNEYEYATKMHAGIMKEIENLKDNFLANINDENTIKEINRKLNGIKEKYQDAVKKADELKNANSQTANSGNSANNGKLKGNRQVA